MHARLKSFLGAAYYMLVFAVSFSMGLSLLGLIAYFVPDAPTWPVHVFGGIWIFGGGTWMMMGMYRSVTETNANLTQYFKAAGFREQNNVLWTTYRRRTEQGVTKIKLRKGRSEVVLEIHATHATGFKGCIGQAPLVFDGFLAQESTKDYTLANFDQLQLKLDSPAAYEQVQHPHWQDLLAFLQDHRAAVYTQKGAVGFLRVPHVGRVESVMALYEIMERAAQQ